MVRKKKGKQTIKSKRTNTRVKGSRKTVANKFSQQKQQLALALDAAKMGIWEWNITKNVIVWSDRIFELFGLDRRKKLTFELYQRLLHPDDQAHVMAAVKDALSRNENADYFIQHRIARADGSVRWIEALGKVFTNKKGVPVKMLGTAVDITEKKIIELEIEDWKKRYEIVRDALGQIIYDYNIPTGNMVWSGNTIGILGMTPSEMGNIDHWLELIHADDREETFNKLRKSQNDVSSFEARYRFRDKRGNYRIIHDKGTFLTDRKNKANRLVGVMQDVTEQIATQNDLMEKSHFIERITAALPDFIYVFDIATMRPIYTNRSILPSLGYSEREANELRKNIAVLLHPDDQSGFFNLETSFDDAPDGTVWPGEYRIKHADGTWRWMLTVNTIFRRDKNGKPIQIIGSTRDITEQKRSSELLKEQNEQLHELTEELRRKVLQLEEFTQIVSHNLRSPVGNILTLLNYFENTDNAAEKQEYFSLIKQSSHDTFLTLDELNEVLRIKQEFQIERQEVSFEKILTQVENMLSASISESHTTIKVDFAVNNMRYPTIYLESILLNLISNSIKYRRKDSPPVITVKTYKKNGCVIMEVSDNGLGIDMSRYGHQLFRMRKTFHNHPESRGVGLFITKNQIETMGGEITAHGKVNEGMTFIITFNKTQSP
jgi:PAS domain S-box-containing protein